MAKKRRTARSRRATGAGSDLSTYRHNLRQADDILAEREIDPRLDTWEALVLEGVTAEGRDRTAMARYIDAHRARLGVPWAREMLRMEVFFQARDLDQVIAHYERALARYPPCPLPDMWAAGPLIRHGGDFWQTRRMLRYTIAHLPDHAMARYDMGYLCYLLGDFPGALDWYDRAVPLVTDDEKEMGARLPYNRAIVRQQLGGSKRASVADLKQAIKWYPGYEQARKALRGFRTAGSDMRYVPW
ncbi:MAG: tetratricopeptide repeat protein [Anaerolineae bacterium]|nr:tetratricopeptide repeat protein [Anaerolineae bacterium]